ncbi:MAG: UTP--glucose-1-phosphate uridylyltransferase [Elusimicrobia bacterium RIFOXYB2_FULL_49_7]|nr:MAG: UTP--glucose-1-phosphate uridylyltransferase [Elusimicrobia bacterium RIFOXYB2_FULL_49_7]
MNPDFTPFEDRMRAEALPALAINTFRHYYLQLVKGETGLIPENAIKPVDSLPDTGTFGPDLAEAGRQALSKAVLIKLNGGLGTGMGLDKAKSLLVVKNGLSFLDIIAQQAMRAGVPLVLMNSFSTRNDSLDALRKYPALFNGPLPLDFLQHKALKINQADFQPVTCPISPELEWYPPGHGDLYTALLTSGILDKLLDAGCEYAFVSNADNLGASLNTAILGFFAVHGLPFMMECASRTDADKKGGHLARSLADGRLLLRESAQCPDTDLDDFQNIRKHRYFNTNNLWVNLLALKKLLTDKQGVLGLPMIRNSKTADPRNSGSTPVYQLETAMGSAISVFPNAGAVCVPRERFAPVKSNSDLLAVRSDAYLLNEDYQVVINPKRERGPLVVDLDNKVYKLIDHFEARFPQGAPSLINCERLTVKGDVCFGAQVTVSGSVTIENKDTVQKAIPDNTRLDG